jgi:hypothetical protein
MEYAFEFGGFPEDVTVTASGDARVSEFRQLFEDLCDQPSFEAGMRVLLDLGEVDMGAIPLMEAPKIGLSLAEFQDHCEGCSIAVVSRDPLTSVLTRAAEFRETVEHVDVWVAVTREEAREWLLLQIVVGEEKRKRTG